MITVVEVVPLRPGHYSVEILTEQLFQTEFTAMWMSFQHAAVGINCLLLFVRLILRAIGYKTARLC